MRVNGAHSGSGCCRERGRGTPRRRDGAQDTRRPYAPPRSPEPPPAAAPVIICL